MVVETSWDRELGYKQEVPVAMCSWWQQCGRGADEAHCTWTWGNKTLHCFSLNKNRDKKALNGVLKRIRVKCFVILIRLKITSFQLSSVSAKSRCAVATSCGHATVVVESVFKGATSLGHRIFITCWYLFFFLQKMKQKLNRQFFFKLKSYFVNVAQFD